MLQLSIPTKEVWMYRRKKKEEKGTLFVALTLMPFQTFPPSSTYSLGHHLLEFFQKKQ